MADQKHLEAFCLTCCRTKVKINAELRPDIPLPYHRKIGLQEPSRSYPVCCPFSTPFPFSKAMLFLQLLLPPSSPRCSKCSYNRAVSRTPESTRTIPFPARGGGPKERQGRCLPHLLSISSPCLLIRELIFSPSSLGFSVLWMRWSWPSGTCQPV